MKRSLSMIALFAVWVLTKIVVPDSNIMAAEVAEDGNRLRNAQAESSQRKQRLRMRGPSGVFLLRQAELYRKLGNFDAAESVTEELLAWTEATLGSDHPEAATRLMDLGRLCMEQEKFAAAETHFRRALAVMEDNYSRDRIELVPALGALAGLYRSQARYAEASALYYRAISIAVYTSGSESLLTLKVLREIAELHRREKKYDMAEPYYRYVLGVIRKTGDSNHSERPIAEAAYASMERERNSLVTSRYAAPNTIGTSLRAKD